MDDITKAYYLGATHVLGYILFSFKDYKVEFSLSCLKRIENDFNAFMTDFNKNPNTARFNNTKNNISFNDFVVMASK